MNACSLDSSSLTRIKSSSGEQTVCPRLRSVLFRNTLMFRLLCPQFVPFRDYMDRTGNHVLSMARLAKDVLAEIPDQFISYMKSRGIKPNPAPPPYTPPGHTHHHTQI